MRHLQDNPFSLAGQPWVKGKGTIANIMVESKMCIHKAMIAFQNASFVNRLHVLLQTTWSEEDQDLLTLGIIPLGTRIIGAIGNFWKTLDTGTPTFTKPWKQQLVYLMMTSESWCLIVFSTKWERDSQTHQEFLTWDTKESEKCPETQLTHS